MNFKNELRIEGNYIQFTVSATTSIEYTRRLW